MQYHKTVLHALTIILSSRWKSLKFLWDLWDKKVCRINRHVLRQVHPWDRWLKRRKLRRHERQLWRTTPAMLNTIWMRSTMSIKMMSVSSRMDECRPRKLEFKRFFQKLWGVSLDSRGDENVYGPWISPVLTEKLEPTIIDPLQVGYNSAKEGMKTMLFNMVGGANCNIIQ